MDRVFIPELGHSLCQLCGKGEAWGGVLCDECREYVKVFDYVLVKRDQVNLRAPIQD